jgi:hypothetical protein
MADQTFYIDPTIGNDGTGTEGNPSLPYKTISAAIDDVSATGADVATIRLVDGTYDKITQVYSGDWRLQFDSGEAGTNIVIRPDTAEVITLDFDVESTSAYAVNYAGTSDGIHVTFNDLIMVCDARDQGFALDADSIGSSLTLNNISIANTASGVVISVALGTGPFQKLEINDCDLACDGAGQNVIFSQNDITDGIYITNSTLRHFATDINSNAISASETATVTNLSIIDSTIQGGRRGLISQRWAKNILLDNVDFTSTQITVGDDAGPSLVCGYEWDQNADWATGQAYSIGDLKQSVGTLWECHQAVGSSAATEEPGVGATYKQFWALYTGINLVARNCSFTIDDVGAAHACGIFYGVNAVLIGCTASGGDSQFVVKGENAVICYCSATGANPCSVKGADSSRVFNNYFRATSGFALGVNDQDGFYPVKQRIFNNILIGTGGGIPFTNNNNPTPDLFADNNIFWNETGTQLAALGFAGNQTSIAEIQAYYEDYVFPTNEANGLEQDPGSATGILIDDEWYGIPGTGGGVSKSRIFGAM